MLSIFDSDKYNDKIQKPSIKNDPASKRQVH